MEDTELDSSELGTHKYWQETYKADITNFDNHGDPGDIWFGEDSALRVINWISKNVSKDTAIADLGCGNGYTLLELAREGFMNLLGLDYCQEAITLSQRIALKECPFLQFQVFDIIKDDVKQLGHFGLIHDKGTYDAVSLSPDDQKGNRLKYIDRTVELLEDNGIFVITSCNWTEAELVKQFSDKIKLKCVIPTPQFKFGGQVGSVVSSVVFQKNQ